MGGQQVLRDGVPPIVADDTLALDRGAQLHLLALLVERLVEKDLELSAGLLQRVKVLALSSGAGAVGRLEEGEGAVGRRVCLFDTHTSKTMFHHNHCCICHICHICHI